MRKTLPQDIQDCYAYAAQCRQQADDAPDSHTRVRLLDMERRWLWLAQSYTFADRLNQFVAELKRPCPSVARLKLVAARR
jgi:hypothetical protein